jgi:hypothetical protein
LTSCLRAPWRRRSWCRPGLLGEGEAGADLDAGAADGKHLLEILEACVVAGEVEGQLLDRRLELDQMDLVLRAVDGEVSRFNIDSPRSLRAPSERECDFFSLSYLKPWEGHCG